MYPSGHKRGNVLQGLPVAIGTERRSIYTEDTSSTGTRSGESSPRSFDGSTPYGDNQQITRGGRRLQNGF